MTIAHLRGKSKTFTTQSQAHVTARMSVAARGEQP